MRNVVFGFIVVLTDAAVVVWETPCCVVVTGIVKALPRLSCSATVTGTVADEVLASVITVLQPPPAAICDKTPIRAGG